MAHDEKGSLVCRDCESGIRHFRGMYHLSRKDLHEKAASAAMAALFSDPEPHKQILTIAMQQTHILMSRLDWMTAAFDLIEDRLMGDAAASVIGGDRRPLNATSNAMLAEEEEEDDEMQCSGQQENEDVDEHLRLLKECSVNAMLSLNLFGSLDDVGDLDANAKVCANCGKDDAPQKCAGCRALCFCSQDCFTNQWKASHKNCCLRAETVAYIFDRLVNTNQNLTLVESKTLASMISGPLMESERHRRKLGKAHPQGAAQIASLFETVEKSEGNLDYLEHLSMILLAICSRRAGRRGMDTDGLFGLQRALMDGDFSSPHNIMLAKVFRLMGRSSTRTRSP